MTVRLQVHSQLPSPELFTPLYCFLLPPPSVLYFSIALRMTGNLLLSKNASKLVAFKRTKIQNRGFSL